MVEIHSGERDLLGVETEPVDLIHSIVVYNH